MLCIISAYFVGLVIYGFDKLAVCSVALACGSGIRAGSWVLLASIATPVAVKDEKRKRFKRCAAQIARPNTAPTGR